MVDQSENGDGWRLDVAPKDGILIAPRLGQSVRDRAENGEPDQQGEGGAGRGTTGARERIRRFDGSDREIDERGKRGKEIARLVVTNEEHDAAADEQEPRPEGHVAPLGSP